MKLGIVSDTHDDADAVTTAVEQFRSQNVDTVIHCGDFVAPFSATPFDAQFAFHAVRGNNDGEWALADTVESFGTYHGEAATLTVDGVAVAAYHGTSEPLVDGLVGCGDYDIVVRGHTHERTREHHAPDGEVTTFDTDGTTEHDLDAAGTLHLNPGGVVIPGQEESPAVIVIDTEAGTVRFESLTDA
ncbi:metallophosphoesterase [Halobaculum sp. MBLA0143]|uniref:metallophosphoesterase n=1 Tax=Halobaculum sp. MBLA0143 TaxID=3079933 RepID=UPI003526BE81